MSEITFEQVLSQVKVLPLEDAVKLRDYLNAQIQHEYNSLRSGIFVMSCSALCALCGYSSK